MTQDTQIAMGRLWKNMSDERKKKHSGFEQYYNAHKEVIDMEGEEVVTPEVETEETPAEAEVKEEEED